MTGKDKKSFRPNYNQSAIIRRRGLNPANYVVVKESYSTLYLRDLRTNMVKIITKNN